MENPFANLVEYDFDTPPEVTIDLPKADEAVDEAVDTDLVSKLISFDDIKEIDLDELSDDPPEDLDFEEDLDDPEGEKYFLDNYQTFCTHDPSPSRLSHADIRKMRDTYQISNPPNAVPTNPAFSRWTYEYIHCPALNQHIPISRHPDMESSVHTVKFLFQSARNYEQDTRMKILQAHELDTPEGITKLKEHIGNGSLTVVTDSPSKFDGISMKIDDPKLRLCANMHEAVKPLDCLTQRHQSLQLDDFVTLSDDPLSVYDLDTLSAWGEGDRPAYIVALADDRRALRQHALDIIPSGLVHYPAWMQLSHAFATSQIKIESRGFGRYSNSLSGTRYWMYLQWCVEPLPRDYLVRYQCMETQNTLSMEYSSKPPWITKTETGVYQYSRDEHLKDPQKLEKKRVARWYVIELKPGMTVIQPPNVPYFVYTPSPSISLNGQFLSSRTMTHTRKACRSEVTAKLTSSDYPFFTHLLDALCLSLVHTEAGRVKAVEESDWEEKDVVALIRLILGGSRYMTTAKQTRSHKLALEAAKLLIKTKRLKIPGPGKSATWKELKEIEYVD